MQITVVQSEAVDFNFIYSNWRAIHFVAFFYILEIDLQVDRLFIDWPPVEAQKSFLVFLFVLLDIFKSLEAAVRPGIDSMDGRWRCSRRSPAVAVRIGLRPCPFRRVAGNLKLYFQPEHSSVSGVGG